MIWYFIVALTQISLQVSSKFGFKTFSRIVRGVYNVPHEEEKVVMFVDINGSTAIAEELGKERYYNFLKDFFSDIADPILNNAGQIYQYVGDEVVIVWNYEAGSDYSCCAQCFFDIKAQIEKKREKYLRRYGTVPTFKGAIHAGTVIAGEVGTIKREITYSGDVLNTTSRMQSLCGKLNSELLVSSQLLAAIDRNRYDVRPLGSFKLRGKDQEIFLQSLTAA
jgi:adenylate cyclase